MPEREIRIAEHAGFCFGVRRAVGFAEDLLQKGVKIATLGELIHNPQITKSLYERGVRVVNSPGELSPDETLVIRSHGVPHEIVLRLEQLGNPVCDATCPYVAHIHRIVAEASAEDLVLIAGDSSHPEVQGIAGHCTARCLIAGSAEELENISYFMDKTGFEKCILVAQTTFLSHEWRKCAEIVKKLFSKVEIFDTICSATEIRQKEAETLARQSDVMIVIGGRHSSNTTKLADLCRSFCRTIHIEQADELRSLNWDGAFRIGVTAGASTPTCIIEEVQETMSEMLENKGNNEEISFEEMLDQTFKSTYTGERVTGVVTGIAPTEVSVEIGTKHTGYIPLHELTDDPNAKPEDIVQIGQELSLKVLRVNDVEGTMVLSKKRVDAEANFDQIANAVDTGEVFEGIITDIVKGGAIAVTKGVRVFIPASHATLSRGEDLNGLLRQSVQFKILEVNPQRKRAIGSIKSVLIEQRKALADQLWETLAVGNSYTGTVKSLTTYGAFVDLGGADGMVHISELSWMRIKHPSEVVKVGDTVEVYVKDLDAENRKISLGYKKTDDNPWEVLRRDYPTGTLVTVKVVSLTAFGAFAQIIPGIDGLIHISQISSERIGKPADVLSVGQEVEVIITEIDFEKKRVSLSMKAAAARNESAEDSADDEPKVFEFAPPEAAQDAPEAKEVQEAAADDAPEEEAVPEETPAENE